MMNNDYLMKKVILWYSTIKSYSIYSLKAANHKSINFIWVVRFFKLRHTPCMLQTYTMRSMRILLSMLVAN